jgi:hypothetical protein
MDEKSHLTLKEASEIIEFPYLGIKSLFDYAGFVGEKQGSSWIYKREDVDAASIALKIGFKYAEACEVEKGPARMAGHFHLADGSYEDAKICPYCGSDELSIDRRTNPDNSIYAFIKCRNCRGSSGSSKARKANDLALCEREAISNWNKRS